MKYLKTIGACSLLALSASSFAGTCPSDLSGIWFATNQANGGTYAVTDVGANGTDCKLSVTQGPNNNGIATVRDGMDPVETRYRARFYVDATELMAQSTGGIHRFKAFVAGNINNPVSTDVDIRARPAILQMFIVGQEGNAARLGGFCRDMNSDGARARFGDGDNPGSVDLVAGWNVVEVDIQMGAGTGSCKIWVNNNDENTPNWTQTNIDNASLVGVERANIGSTGATQPYADLPGAPVTHFDEFESRRQSFIGFPAP